MPERLPKKEALAHWRNLPDVDPATKVRRIPYKTSGSKYGSDGIRIDGSREFIDAVLSQLKSMLEHENSQTRLECSYQEATDRETGASRGWVCYIRVHERGGEAKMLNQWASGMLGREVIASRGY